MMASKGRAPMTAPATRPLDRRRLGLVTVASIAAILVVNYIVTGPNHEGSPIGLRLAAAAIVTVLVVIARFFAGPRAAAPARAAPPAALPPAAAAFSTLLVVAPCFFAGRGAAAATGVLGVLIAVV